MHPVFVAQALKAHVGPITSFKAWLDPPLPPNGLGGRRW